MIDKPVELVEEIDEEVDVEIEEIIQIERLHLRKFGENIDLLYRPNHEYIEFVKDDENGHLRIKELLHMSREEFRNFLISKKSYITKTKYAEVIKSPKEEWYKGAWQKQTKNILNDINEKNIIEEPIWRN